MINFVRVFSVRNIVSLEVSCTKFFEKEIEYES